MSIVVRVNKQRTLRLIGPKRNSTTARCQIYCSDGVFKCSKSLADHCCLIAILENSTLSQWKSLHFSPMENFNIESMENLVIFLQWRILTLSQWKSRDISPMEKFIIKSMEI